MMTGTNGHTPPVSEVVQPDPQYIIAAMMEEIRALNENKLYLLSVLKQMQAEFTEAKTIWELERASILKSG